MYSGKWLGKFLPLSWGTHCYLNKRAFLLLEKEGVKFGEEFPHLKAINHFEDFNGPDGAWVRGELPTSYMVYNPNTDKGEAPREAVKYLENLFLSLKEKNLIKAAKEAAWFSHLTSDLLWPPHQVGDYQNDNLRFYFWNIKTNWVDGLTGSLWRKNDKHSKIEALTTFTLWKKKIGQSEINHLFVEKAKNDYQNIEPYLKEKAALINKRGAYEKFIKEGFSRELRKEMAIYVFPQIISTIATLWYLAYILSKRE